MTFQMADLRVLQQLQRGNNWLRAVLCTLARRGVAFRLAYPLHTRYILDSMSTLPYYKGGQFLFDLMEWEDFMLDGPPAPLLSSVFNVPMGDQVKALISTMIKTINTQFGPSSELGGIEGGERFTLPEGELPPLESSFYLYQEVVLGVIASQLASNLESETTEPDEQSQLGLTLNPEATVTMPGQRATVYIMVANRTQQNRVIQLSLIGFPQEWALFTESKVDLVAGAEMQVTLTIQPPTDNHSIAHLYSYKVIASAPGEIEPMALATGTLLVQSLVTISLHYLDSQDGTGNLARNGKVNSSPDEEAAH